MIEIRGGGLERVGGTVGGFLGEGTNPWCRSRSSLLLRSLSPPRPSLVHLDLPSAPPVSSCPWDAALSLENGGQCEVEPWSGGISLSSPTSPALVRLEDLEGEEEKKEVATRDRLRTPLRAGSTLCKGQEVSTSYLLTFWPSPSASKVSQLFFCKH